MRKVAVDKKNDVPEEVTLANPPPKTFILKEVMGIFHSTESAKDKMLEADRNLVRSMIICQGTEKRLTLYLLLKLIN